LIRLCVVVLRMINRGYEALFFRRRQNHVHFN